MCTRKDTHPPAGTQVCKRKPPLYKCALTCAGPLHEHAWVCTHACFLVRKCPCCRHPQAHRNTGKRTNAWGCSSSRAAHYAASHNQATQVLVRPSDSTHPLHDKDAVAQQLGRLLTPEMAACPGADGHPQPHAHVHTLLLSWTWPSSGDAPRPPTCHPPNGSNCLPGPSPCPGPLTAQSPRVIFPLFSPSFASVGLI